MAQVYGARSRRRGDQDPGAIADDDVHVGLFISTLFSSINTQPLGTASKSVWVQRA